MTKRIHITELDARRLTTLIERAPRGDARQQEYLNRLKGEVDRAKIVDEDHLPNGLITMNSVVELEDLSDGEVMTYQLVFPEEADPAEGRISILAPLGTGMLGYKAGDQFSWETPGGKVKMKVRNVSTPPKASEVL